MLRRWALERIGWSDAEHWVRMQGDGERPGTQARPKASARFNNLDYLRDDELGLSRIIADLLNPKASHGQGCYSGVGEQWNENAR